MTDQQPDSREPTEAELREQLEKVRVQDVVIQTIVSIVNLSAAKADDKVQLQVGIEASKALLALVRDELGDDAKAFDDAVAQLQLAYAQAPAAAAAPESGATAPAAEPGGPGPAQSSGKLWIPGQ
ncbi:MAG TPA: hypothetical protein VNT22_09680 [Baekduia sp.]|nr:hypothetical protein [Baekduia sp.]